MMIRLKIEYGRSTPEPEERDMFESCHVKGRSPWKGLAISAALHCLLVPILPALIEQLPAIGWMEPQGRVIAASPILLRLPERVYLEYSRPLPVPETSRKADSAAAPVPGAGGPNAVEESGYRTYANRRFELPVQSVSSRVEQTLLQPNISLTQDPKDLARLPHLMFWSPQLSTPPVPKPFVMPGRQIQARDVTAVAPPKLTIPNQEIRISDLQIGRSGAMVANPALAAPPASSAAVRTFEPPKENERQALSMHRSDGDPANVLALNEKPAAPISEVTLPATSQIGRLPRAVYGTSEGNGAIASGGERKREQVQVGSTGEAASSSTAGHEVEGEQAASAESASLGRSAEAPLPSAPRTHGTPLGSSRMVHPENGVFDVVLIQASADPAMFSGQVLSGRPVHTVYLQVGAPREWILQYCIPQGSEYRIQQGGSVVQLGNPAPVKAPYPKVTVLPPAPLLAQASRVVVHGFLTEQGLLRDLKMIGEDQKQTGTQIIPYLQEWEFRPAARDGRAIEVEVVLTIPAPRA